MSGILAWSGVWLATGEKSHAATPRRRQQARKEGQGGFSPDFQSGLVLLIGFIVLRWYLPWSGTHLVHLESGILSMPVGPGVGFQAMVGNIVGLSVRKVADILMPIVLPLSLLGLGVGVAQHGFRLSFQTLKMDFGRLNPFSALVKMFSRESLWLLIKGLLKLAVIGTAAGWLIVGQIRAYPNLVQLPLGTVVQQSGSMLTQVLLRAALAYFVIGLVDLAYQYFSFQKSIRMTTQELRDEMKDVEGNPQVKGKRRELARRLAQTGLKEVKRSQVVVTNPTHYAVALKWDEKTMQAPVVVAKGQDETALAIRELAYRHEVPVVENPPLARSLYHVPLGQAILEEHYQMVADILAYLISRKQGGAPS